MGVIESIRNPVTEQYLLEILIDPDGENLRQIFTRAAWVPHQRDIALKNLQESILKCIQEE